MEYLKQQDQLTRVGPGTAMGQLMRQYWIPAAKSGEVVADGPPLRLMLLGEKLIAFRDTDGHVGIMDHRCPHRGASLFLGRNEEGGIRCIYHGWKFQVDGKCVEMPSVPPSQDFKEKIRAKAYRTHERNGLVWVYMGERAEPPPLPMIEAAILPEGELDVSFIMRRCNWLQAMEGDVDTSHIGFLHFGSLDPDNIPEGHPLQHVTARAPEYHARDAAWGTSYSSYRPAQGTTGAAKTYWRCSNFMFPFWTQTPQGEFRTNINARGWVPIDDEHTMFVYLRWTKRPGYDIPLKDGKVLPGSATPLVFKPNTTDWLGRYVVAADESNDWMQDRSLQSGNTIFSGIENVHLQDQAITESMGAMSDHRLEHLGPGDKMVMRTRRRLLQAAQAFSENGTVPPGVDDPQVFLHARAGYFLEDPSVGWLAAYESQVAASKRPWEDSPAAEHEAQAEARSE